MSVSRDNLLATIEKLKHRILKVEKSSTSITEQDTRQGLINYLFRSLGWDFSDFTTVKSEFRHPKYNEAVDYALFCDNSVDKPVLLIEAKALGTNLNNGKIIKQLCAYMGQIGVQWGVLTDGNKYVMYNSNAGVSFEEQKFLTLQIKTTDTEDGIPSEKLAEELVALLSRGSLENNGIQEFYRKHAINRHIEDAMWSLFSEPFDTLANAIKREFKQERVNDPKLRVSTKQIIDYLETMKDEEGRIPLSLDEVTSSTEYSLLQEVAVISQQKNADVSPITRARRISISDLLADGLIKASDNWRFYYKGEVTWGRITTNGEIEVNSTLYTNPSKAGNALNSTSACNGWDHWYYKDKQGEWHKVKMLREQYRKIHRSETTKRKKAS